MSMATPPLHRVRSRDVPHTEDYNPYRHGLGKFVRKFEYARALWPQPTADEVCFGWASLDRPYTPSLTPRLSLADKVRWHVVGGLTCNTYHLYHVVGGLTCNTYHLYHFFPLLSISILSPLIHCIWEPRTHAAY